MSDEKKAKVRITNENSAEVGIVLVKKSTHSEHYRLLDILKLDEFGVYDVGRREYMLIVEIEKDSTINDIKWDKDHLIFKNNAAITRERRRKGRE